MKQYLTTFLSAAMLLTSAAQAMTFDQFDHMAAQDRQAYMNFLVEAAQEVLIDEGKRDVADKVYRLFHEIHPGDELPIGEAEFEGNLANARVRDAEKHAKDHNAPRVQVESALTETLKKNGIELSPDSYKDLVQMASTFKHKVPPQEEERSYKK
jgi:hypothetical protein